jgi:hypothetical protein
VRRVYAFAVLAIFTANASRILVVASVVNNHSSGDFAVQDFPSDSVHTLIATFKRHHQIATCVGFTVRDNTVGHCHFYFPLVP